MAKVQAKQLVVCVNNDGYAASLETRRRFALRDASAEKHGLLRIADEPRRLSLSQGVFRSISRRKRRSYRRRACDRSEDRVRSSNLFGRAISCRIIGSAAADDRPHHTLRRLVDHGATDGAGSLKLAPAGYTLAAQPAPLRTAHSVLVARMERAGGRRPTACAIRGRSRKRHESRITPRRVFDARVSPSGLRRSARGAKFFRPRSPCGDIRALTNSNAGRV